MHLESCHLWDLICSHIKTPGREKYQSSHSTKTILSDPQPKAVHESLGRSIGEYVQRVVWKFNLTWTNVAHESGGESI